MEELLEGINRFVKGDMTGNEELFGGEIEAFVTAMVSRVTKEDTRGRTGFEFVNGGGGDLWVTKATKSF